MKQVYEDSKVAIDPVILTIHNGELKVFLYSREKEPFHGYKELPGGLLRQDESAKETLQRKLSDLVGYKNIYLQQFFTFTDPKRDPRERVISIGFISLINQEKIKDFSMWYSCESLPKLAFDHKKMIKQAILFLKENNNSNLIKEFMPKLFPLNTLQEVYEIIQKEKFDNRNFRKKMLNSGLIEVTDMFETNVSHRPAKLCKFVK